MIKKKVLVLLGMVLFFSTMSKAQAPWQPVWVQDTVNVSPGSITDVYYSFNNGISKAENNRNYHLAFSMSPIVDSAALWANHQNGNNFTKVFHPHKDKSQFASVGLADTTGATILFNNDKGWYDGAFNHIYNADIFNFGWGTYNSTNHNVYGDSVFIVRAQGTYFKLIIDSLNGINTTYYFRTENLSTPGSTNSYTITKSPKYSNSLFAYFNLNTGMDTLREPASSSWDLLFTRYTTDALGSGQGTNNNVLGVLLNKGVKASKAQGVLEDTAYDYRTTYTMDSLLSKIGYDWKVFDLASTSYFALDSLSYFVSDKSNTIWQLDFLGYDLPSGLIDFRKRKVWALAVENLPSVLNNVAVAPNPVNDKMNIILDSKNTQSVNVQVLDFQGRVLFSKTIKTQEGLNSFEIPVTMLSEGNYVLNLTGDAWHLSEKVTVRK